MGIGPARYEIRVQGTLDADWSEWFDGIEILPGGEDETLIRGVLRDQAALHGLLARVCDLGLTLVSVRRTSD